MEKSNYDNEAINPLPNPGEGGPVYPGNNNNGSNIPVAPLPNPGEGGPVYPGNDNNGSNIPVTPLPNPGEGGPVYPGNENIPVIPLPNPGEGGPVAPGPVIPTYPNIWQTMTTVRFLNGAYGYGPFMIYINKRRAVRSIKYGSITGYGYISVGYQTITVMGLDGYIYVQKSLPFQRNTPTTVAVINTITGLDIIEINDTYVQPSNYLSNLRVSNLAYYTNPIDVILRDGRVIFSDVNFKETTEYKRIKPGDYELIIADTSWIPMPIWEDIENINSIMPRTSQPINELAIVDLHVDGGYSYTLFVLSNDPSTGEINTLIVAD